MRNAVFATLAGAACIAMTACNPTQEAARARSSPSSAAAVSPIGTSAQTEPGPVGRLDDDPGAPAWADSTAAPQGVTEAQPDAKTRAPKLLTAASVEQIDRLSQVERREAENDRAPRVAVDSALVDLVAKSEKVTQDLRDLELPPVSRSADISMQLETDLADLEQSLQNSYVAVPVD